ncbi:MAG: hypothetical protein PHR06_11860 [Candidatus Cloacimonetes bacterium]|nr:hypothetical protein [Candidatus Cloacimonadota bacterium]
MKVYNNFGEFIIEIENNFIILSSNNAKKFLFELRDKIEAYEDENGKIKLPEKQDAFSQSLYKNLYFSKKISKNLSVVGKKRNK